MHVRNFVILGGFFGSKLKLATQVCHRVDKDG